MGELWEQRTVLASVVTITIAFACAVTITVAFACVVAITVALTSAFANARLPIDT